MTETSKESLVDFLKLKNLKLKEDGYFLRDIVSLSLVREYGYLDMFYSVDDEKLELKSLLDSAEFTEAFVQIPVEKRTQKEMRKIGIMIEKRIDESTLEEVVEAGNVIKEDIEKNNPDTYYYQACIAYYNIMCDLENFSKGMNFFTTKLMPELRTHNNLSVREITSFFGDEFGDARFCLPRNYQIEIMNSKSVTVDDIEKLKSALTEYDKKRNDLHKKILDYGKKHFKKGYLDVFIDIMRNENLQRGGLIHLRPVSKGHSLALDIGYISIPNHFWELGREYGQEIYSRYIDAAFKELEYARKSESDWCKPEYKSELHSERTEEKDNELLDEINKKFEEYVEFKGDYFIKSAHGHYIFRKMIVFSIDKIKEKENNPQAKIEEIKEYIKSVLPKVKQPF